MNNLDIKLQVNGHLLFHLLGRDQLFTKKKQISNKGETRVVKKGEMEKMGGRGTKEGGT